MKAYFLLFFILGCSQINTDSKKYYDQSKSMRHGIVPVSEKKDEKKWKKVFTEANIIAGKRIYQNNCASCHGPQGRGDGKEAANLVPPPRDLSKLSQEVPDFKFFMMVSKWQNEMPGWKNKFSNSDLEFLEAYIHSLAKN